VESEICSNNRILASATIRKETLPSKIGDNLWRLRVKTARPVVVRASLGTTPSSVFAYTSTIYRLEAGVLLSMPKRVGPMNLQIEQREREKIVILDLKGRLVLGDEDLSLLQRLLFLLDSRHRQVILNLKEVSSIDETGLDTVAFCATRFQDVGGRLVLLNLGQSHVQVADIAKLNAVSETYREETDAVNSFFPDRVVPRYDILEFVKEQKQTSNRNSSSEQNRWWRRGPRRNLTAQLRRTKVE